MSRCSRAHSMPARQLYRQLFRRDCPAHARPRPEGCSDAAFVTSHRKRDEISFDPQQACVPTAELDRWSTSCISSLRYVASARIRGRSAQAVLVARSWFMYGHSRVVATPAVPDRVDCLLSLITRTEGVRCSRVGRTNESKQLTHLSRARVLTWPVSGNIVAPILFCGLEAAFFVCLCHLQALAVWPKLSA